MNPFFSKVMSKFTMSPSSRNSAMEGTPWQTTWLREEFRA